MAGIRVIIRRVGNSQGIVIPRTVLAHLGLGIGESVAMTVENDAIVLRLSSRLVRPGWADAARNIADREDETLVMGEFENASDADLAW